MLWFLFDRDLRHERIKERWKPIITQQQYQQVLLTFSTFSTDIFQPKVIFNTWFSLV